MTYKGKMLSAAVGERSGSPGVAQRFSEDLQGRGVSILLCVGTDYLREEPRVKPRNGLGRGS